jgi:hypothetical protein
MRIASLVGPRSARLASALQQQRLALALPATIIGGLMSRLYIYC